MHRLVIKAALVVVDVAGAIAGATAALDAHHADLLLADVETAEGVVHIRNGIGGRGWRSDDLERHRGRDGCAQHLGRHEGGHGKERDG